MEKSFLVSSCFIWLSGLMSALSLDLREEEESLSCDNIHNEIILLLCDILIRICLKHICIFLKTTSREEVRIFLIQVGDCSFLLKIAVRKQL